MLDIAGQELAGLVTQHAAGLLVPINQLPLRIGNKDRIGRVVDQRSIGNTTVDRYQYTYDRGSNVTAKNNLVAETDLSSTAFDEAYTTPTENSVRRAMAIQMIINREWGLSKNENPNQGAFIIDELTDLVEEAVLMEFDRITERGGVLGAMETGYQRGKIQEESLFYEHKKHDGSLPIIGVNTFINPHQEAMPAPPLQRSTTDEKDNQIARLRAFQQHHRDDGQAALERLRKAAIANENMFAVLMDAVRCCSLGQISDALFEVGGQYRRNM